MKIDEFQPKLLFFVRNTIEPITAQNVAYYLKIRIEDAQTHLETLANKNILALTSDENGNIFYEMPNTPRTNNTEMAMAYFFPEIVENSPIVEKKESNFTQRKRENGEFDKILNYIIPENSLIEKNSENGDDFLKNFLKKQKRIIILVIAGWILLQFLSNFFYYF